ncbi:MAG: amino acid adenylation domain-containing protein [Clostridiaceae bacterium]|nr:amino acid adenylation domain-containing protein [Clostridiaceae bacterium]
MKKNKNLNDSISIQELFKNLARQKEITISIGIKENHLPGTMKFSHKTAEEPLIHYSEDAYSFGIGDNMEVSFFYKDTFFEFESQVIDVFQGAFSIKKPDLVNASFTRISTRYKIKKDESTFLRFQENDENFKIIEISTSGLSFELISNTPCEGDILRNIHLNLNETLSFYFDAEVKYVKPGMNSFTCGLSFINLEWVYSQALFHYIFKKYYPNLKSLSDFSEDDISRLYDTTKYTGQKTFGTENNEFNSEIKAIDKVKDKPTIFVNIVYHKNNIITGANSALRIYNRTFVGHQPVLLPETYLNPKKNADIFIGLAEHLLNHLHFENFITYINSDFQWHLSVFENINKIIKNNEKLIFDKLTYYEYSIEDGHSEKVTEYCTEVLDDPSDFIEYCNKSLYSLESTSYSYDKEGFFQGEIKGIYHTLGYSMVRRVFRTKENGKTIAFAVAECFTEKIDFNNNLDTIKVYFVEENLNLKTILNSILSETVMFFKINNKKRFRIYVQLPSDTQDNISIPGLSKNFSTNRVMLSREGMLEFTRLLTSNFEYYTRYYNLSQSQKSIWQTEKFYPGTSIGNIAATMKIKGKIDYFILEKAINIFVEKNDAMRIQVVEDNGIPKQYVSIYSYSEIDFFDFNNCDIKQYYFWNEEQTKKPFKLNDSVLYYFAIVKLKEDLFAIFAKTHHMISDAWSMNLLASQILEYFKCLDNNAKISSAHKPSYLDYVLGEEEYKFSKKMDKSKEFWDKKFETIPEFISFKPEQSIKGTSAKRKTFILSECDTKGIQGYCNKMKISIFTLFISVFSVYLSRKTGCEDLVVGIPILNRAGIKEKDTVGMFINSIPLRLQVNHNMEFEAYLNNIARELNSCFRNQKYNYDMILSNFRSKHNVSCRLYDVVISYQNSKYEKQDNAEDIECKWHFNNHQVDSLVIHIDDREDNGKYVINFDYLVDVFDEAEIGRIFGYIINLIDDAIKKPDEELRNLNMLTNKEDLELWNYIEKYNDTDAEYPSSKVIHQLFEEQASRTPDNIALEFEDKIMTYEKLNNKSNQLARRLRERGVKTNSIVAIMLNRSFEMIIGILGILKSGGTYLPIDPGYPNDRVNYMLENSECDIVLTQDEFMDIIDFSAEKINLADAGLFIGNTSNLKNLSKPDNLAYVIYTSGSTGKPKGAMITHQGLVNYISWADKRYVRGDKISFALYSSISFDLTVTSTFTPLISGNKIVIYHCDNNDILIRRIFEEKKVELVKLTPAHLQLIKDLDNKNSSIKRLILGGEDLKTELSREIHNSFDGKIEIYNEYGPTETVVGCMIYKFNYEKDTEISVPIGKPADNVQIYLLDRYLNPVPFGIPGEMYISGDGVSRGYLNRNKLTMERFMPNPFLPGKRLYRSGDLSVMLPDGNMEYLGRIDNQIKINGFRIELGEIENEILKNDLVKSAVVLDINDSSGRKHLCAYVVKEDNLEIVDLKNTLTAKLPAYMIPYFFVIVDQIPLTSNGKVDRKTLEALNPIKKDDSSYVDPTNELEKELENILCQLLKVDKVSTADNLFDLGMDSLMAMQFISALSPKGFELSIQDIYDGNTIKALSNKLQKNADKSSDYAEDNLKLIKTNLERASDLDNLEMIELEHVFLTGGNGYLGAHVLYELIKSTKAKVYCLVRGETKHIAKERLVKVLDFYFPGEFENVDESRISVLAGDITLEKFGLDDNDYDMLINRVDTVFHLAAIIKLFGNYKEYEAVNVEGTRRVSDFTAKYGKALKYISTTSVSGNYLVKQKTGGMDFTENDLYIGQNFNDNVYIRSKFEAEKIIFDKVDLGLNATIFRVGDLVSRHSDGTFQIDAMKNFTFKILRALIEIEIIPEQLLTEELEFSPVDSASKAIVLLSRIKQNKTEVYHIFNHKRFKPSLVFFDLLKALGYEFKIVKDYSFHKYIEYIKRNSDKIEEINCLASNFNYDHMFSAGYTVNIRSEYTVEVLKRLSFSWPDIDKEYLERAIDYLRDIDFLSK